MEHFLAATELIQNWLENGTVSTILQFFVIYVAALWIALIIWVTRDVINRSNSLIFQVFSISINIILPIFGLLFYLIIRPTETLVEKLYQDLEYKILSEAETGTESCQACDKLVDRSYLFCPECSTQLKKKCTKCHKPYNIEWTLCPFCGTKPSTRKRKK